MGPRKIFYHCFDTDARGGGQKHTYQHGVTA